MRTSENDLNRFLKDYNLEKWNKKNIRYTPKELKNERLYNSFTDSMLLKFLRNNVNPDESVKERFLFSHFSPFLTEVEGLGLPMYTKAKYPNSFVDFTYDKGGKDSIKYNIDKSLLIVNIF